MVRTMFDKQALNNKITASKKSVVKAKNFVIAKLVRKCKKLENMVTKPANNKIKGKIDKITEQISVVKKLNCLQTLKKAILFDKNPNKVMTNGEASVEEIAETLVFSCKIMIEIVKQIKLLFNLNQDSNPGWEKVFQKKKKNKIKNNQSHQNTEVLVQNKSNLTNIENFENEFASKKFVTNKEDIASCKFTKQKPQLTKNHETETRHKKNIEYDINESSWNQNFVSKPDPFFTTHSGENYISLCLDNEIEENSSTHHFNTNSWHNKSIRNLNSNKGNSKIHYKNNYFRNEPEIESNDVLNNNNLSSIKKNVPLHPSWEAKQKIKPIIQKFEGKKITFDI